MKKLILLLVLFFSANLFAEDSCKDFDSERKCSKSGKNCVWIPAGRESKCVSKEEVNKKNDEKNVNGVKIENNKPNVEPPK